MKGKPCVMISQSIHLYAMAITCCSSSVIYAMCKIDWSLKMDGGCAGFFEDDQLGSGAGVVYSNSEIEARENAERKYFTPLLNTHKRSFSKQDLQYLIDGEIEKCFDDISYFPNGRNPSLRIPQPRF